MTGRHEGGDERQHTGVEASNSLQRGEMKACVFNEHIPDSASSLCTCSPLFCIKEHLVNVEF